MVSMYYFITRFFAKKSPKSVPVLSSLPPHEVVAAIDVVGDFALKANFGPHKLPLLQQFGSLPFPYNDSSLFSFQRRMEEEEEKMEEWGWELRSLVRMLLEQIAKKEAEIKSEMENDSKGRRVEVEDEFEKHLRDLNGEGEKEENEEEEEEEEEKILDDGKSGDDLALLPGLHEETEKKRKTGNSPDRKAYTPQETRAVFRAHHHLRQCLILRVEDRRSSYLLSKLFLPALSSAILHASKITLNKGTHRDARSSITPEVRALLEKKFAAEVDLYEYALSLHRRQLDQARSSNVTHSGMFEIEDEYPVRNIPHLNTHLMHNAVDPMRMSEVERRSRDYNKIWAASRVDMDERLSWKIRQSQMDRYERKSDKAIFRPDPQDGLHVRMTRPTSGSRSSLRKTSLNENMDNHR